MAEQTPSTLARVGVVAALLLLGYAFSGSVRTGLADAYAAPAKSYLDARRAAGETLAPEEWQALTDSLTRALWLSPGDPETLSELGRLHRIRLEGEDLDAAAITRLGDAGAAYYQAALAQRPTWPWDWSNLAMVKYQQYQDGSPVYQDAVVRAVAYGPREASIQNRIAELGSRSWASLNAATGQAVLTAVDRALQRDDEALPDMAEDLARWQPLCARAGTTFTYLKRRCAALGLT